VEVSSDRRLAFVERIGSRVLLNVGVECILLLHQLMDHHIVVDVRVYKSQQKSSIKREAVIEARSMRTSPTKKTVEHIVCMVGTWSGHRIRGLI
jgi:hypothetical protein